MKQFFIVFFLVSVSMIKCETLWAQNGSPYAVGSSTFFIHDETRSYDSVAGVNVGVRSLLTEIWYPVNHEIAASGDFRRATYGDYSFGDKNVHKKMLSNTTFFHLTPDTVVEGVTPNQIATAMDELFARQRASYVDAPLAKSKKWPVVLMTHGDAGSRYNMESACEYLAAHGYVVVAPEHTGNTPFAFTSQDPLLETKLSEVKPLLNADGTYGPEDNYGQTYTPLIKNREDPQALLNLDNALLERVNDLRATLRKLESMNKKGRFAGSLDLDQVGVMGRSFGGTTTLAALALEARFSAGFSVVPLVLPDLRKTLPPEALKPVGEESIILAAAGPSALNTISKPTFLLSGAEDALIIGVGASMSKAFQGEEPSPDNPLPALRASYSESKLPTMWGLLENSNHGSFGVSGPYWWPDLKAKTQPRFFNPEEIFTLVDADTAHNIQKQKALEFFDAFLGKKQGAIKSLASNKFASDGLILETRNLGDQ